MTATGGGKTVVGSEATRLAALRNRRVLWLAHREEIISQTSRSLWRGGVEHGIIQAGTTPRDATVQLASIQTLARRMDRLPPADMLIVDEGHHSAAASWLSLILAYRDAYQIALTATPYRLDGTGMGNLDGQGFGFQKLIVIAQVHELTPLYLVPARVFAPPGANLSRVGTTKGDYDLKEASNILMAPQLVGDVVAQWQKLATGRLTLCFASSIEHSRALVARFLEAGVPAEHVDAKSKERAASIERFQRRETLILSNVGLFTEGTDIPECAAVISARMTQSPGLWRQICGRPLRKHPDKLDAIIIDHVGNASRHGLPSDPQMFTLDGCEPRTKEAIASVTTCKACFAVYPSLMESCPLCGAPRPAIKRKPMREVDGELVEMTGAQVFAARASATQQIAYLRKQLAIAQERGWKKGAVPVRFKMIFKRWPSRAEMDAASR